MTRVFFSNFEQRSGASVLYVVLHAYNNGPQHVQGIRAAIREIEPDADILCPEMPTGLFSLADPEDIAAQIKERIDLLFAENAYDRIVLVGHSVGALICRRVYLLAFGGPPVDARDADTGTEAAVWVGRVDRIIQFAAMSRGWTINHHLSRKTAFGYRVGLAALLPWGFMNARTPLILHIRKGAPFLTRLRMDWVNMANEVRRRAGAGQEATHVPTIQLLGTIDDTVAPEDNIDPVAGSAFFYRDVPGSGHGDVIDFGDTAALPSQGGEPLGRGDARKAVFQEVATATVADLTQSSVHPADETFADVETDVTHVVFVVHGIRDVGYWTHKIARAIMRRANAPDLRDKVKVRSQTSSYGFFPIISFLRPAKRMEKVDWFMDQYVQVRARYPEAAVSFVGHSHGTYLLARSLREYEFCRFDTVVFAGSVVRRAFPWRDFIAQRQVRKMINYVATADWVVAFFPKAFQAVGWQDLGSAGHDGFDQAVKDGPELFEVEYVRGDHGAAIQEGNWNDIAAFIFDPRQIEPAAGISAPRRNWLVERIGFVAPAVPLLIVAVAVLIGYVLYQAPTTAWSNELLVGVYAFLVVKGLSKL
ncbi:esterase/lipase family protein [Tateyamaria omphalii]|uniref:Uncharacterized protein n=1 Tax=Tateyamaria omphalii TaxID=299262 RepID=A0A1P8MWY6_9RHOB|nr:hypothetical protein [Tateyamaria omphalii]APX12617.1 hypothetical protein BWR18_13685 [Tateyamaria omphalii]